FTCWLPHLHQLAPDGEHLVSMLSLMRSLVRLLSCSDLDLWLSSLPSCHYPTPGRIFSRSALLASSCASHLLLLRFPRTVTSTFFAVLRLNIVRVLAARRLRSLDAPNIGEVCSVALAAPHHSSVYCLGLVCHYLCC